MYCTIARPTEREDVTLYYEDLGEGSPLVFLHSLGCASWAWRRQLAHFRKSHRAIAPDLRGHGRSSAPPGPYTIARLAEDVGRFLQRLSLPPAVLVGHSLGGRVALHLATREPSALLALVLVGAESGAPAPGERARLEEALRAAREGGVAAALERGGEGLGLPWTRDARERREFGRLVGATSPEGFFACGRAILEMEDLSPLLDSVRCPALAVVGEGDRERDAAARLLAERMPACEAVVVEGAGHYVPLEQPEAFNALLADFLRRVLAA